jgi:hypothetical protein
VSAQRITRDDLEARLREFQGGVGAKVDDKKPTLIAGAAFAGVFVLLVFFLLGRRSGKKKSAIVEIRRV